MMPTIRIDDDVFNGLKQLAEAFVDTPNTVIKRLLAASQGAVASTPSAAIVRTSTSHLTPRDYQAFLLRTLAQDFGGTGEKREVQATVIRKMTEQGILCDADHERVTNGETKAENMLGWARNALKTAGLLDPATKRGVWALTPLGLSEGLAHSGPTSA